MTEVIMEWFYSCPPWYNILFSTTRQLHSGIYPPKQQQHNIQTQTKIQTVLVVTWRLLEFNLTVKVTVIIQRNQSLSIGSCVNQAFHAHSLFTYVTRVSTTAASNDHSHQKNKDEIDSTVPCKEESGNHKFVRVILLPRCRTRKWVVENETHLPEPRSLDEKKIRAP